MMDLDRELDDGLDAWYNGWYEGIDILDDSKVMVEIFESVMNQPTDEELIEDPGLIGAVYFTEYGYKGDEMIELEGGLFEYHEGCTFGKFLTFLRDVFGIMIKDRVSEDVREELEMKV